MNKKIIVIIIVLFVGAAILVALQQIKKTTPAPTGTSDTTNKPANTNEKPSHEVKVIEVDHAQLPENFPADVPTEKGAVIVYNFNAINAQGQDQSSREFISKETLKKNFDLYTKVLKDGGWTITGSTDGETQKIILATKGDNSLTIRIYTDSVTKKNRESMNNIVAKK